MSDTLPFMANNVSKKPQQKNKRQLPFQDLLEVAWAFGIYPESMGGSWEASECKMRIHLRLERSVSVKPE